MRALYKETLDAAWASAEALIPADRVTHPFGGDRPRVDDRVCFRPGRGAPGHRMVLGHRRGPNPETGVGGRAAAPLQTLGQCRDVRLGRRGGHRVP